MSTFFKCRELRSDSDIDFLVEFLPQARVGLLALAALSTRLHLDRW